MLYLSVFVCWKLMWSSDVFSVTESVNPHFICNEFWVNKKPRFFNINCIKWSLCFFLFCSLRTPFPFCFFPGGKYIFTCSSQTSLLHDSHMLVKRSSLSTRFQLYIKPNHPTCSLKPSNVANVWMSPRINLHISVQTGFIDSDWTHLVTIVLCLGWGSFLQKSTFVLLKQTLFWSVGSSETSWHQAAAWISTLAACAAL